MEKSCDRLSPFVCWLGGLGCVPGEFHNISKSYLQKLDL